MTLQKKNNWAHFLKLFPAGQAFHSQRPLRSCPSPLSLVCKATQMALIAFIFLVSHTTQAQSELEQEFIKDPLLKPSIWNQLELQPKSETLWQKYFSKSLFDLSQQEYQLYTTLKSKLLEKERLAEQEAAKRKNERKLKYYNQKLNSEDNEYYLSLIQNIEQNITIIDLYFKEKYQELGFDYITYKEAYPQEDYSKTKWVEEKEKQLAQLKHQLQEN